MQAKLNFHWIILLGREREREMAQNTAQANKSKAITLKGSAELIGEFFGMSVLYYLYCFTMYNECLNTGKLRIICNYRYQTFLECIVIK